jgi:hypothetical protein
MPSRRRLFRCGAVQLLDGTTQGFTYPGWEHDLESEESRWVGGFVTAASINKLRAERMRRRQRLYSTRLSYGRSSDCNVSDDDAT